MGWTWGSDRGDKMLKCQEYLKWPFKERVEGRPQNRRKLQNITKPYTASGWILISYICLCILTISKSPLLGSIKCNQSEKKAALHFHQEQGNFRNYVYGHLLLPRHFHVSIIERQMKRNSLFKIARTQITGLSCQRNDVFPDQFFPALLFQRLLICCHRNPFRLTLPFSTGSVLDDLLCSCLGCSGLAFAQGQPKVGLNDWGWIDAWWLD